MAGSTLPKRSRRWPNSTEGIATAMAQPGGWASQCRATKPAVVERFASVSGPASAGRTQSQQLPLQHAPEHELLDDRPHEHERHPRRPAGADVHAVAERHAEREPDRERREHCRHDMDIAQPRPPPGTGPHQPAVLEQRRRRRGIGELCHLRHRLTRPSPGHARRAHAIAIGSFVRETRSPDDETRSCIAGCVQILALSVVAFARQRRVNPRQRTGRSSRGASS